MKALIVDDSSVMRKVVERALRQAGLDLTEVLEAGDGLEALELLRTLEASGSRINIILTDIHMPLMDGLDFVEGIRDEHLAQDVPVVMLTTEGAEENVVRAIAAGARGYICKPFTSEQIRSRIMPLLRATRHRYMESSLAEAHA